jgi:hypothetical protein
LDSWGLVRVTHAVGVNYCQRPNFRCVNFIRRKSAFDSKELHEWVSHGVHYND